jgi:cytochrome c biogenesis protein CcmG/thiol:disulfide interchange protein DsbE
VIGSSSTAGFDRFVAASLVLACALSIAACRSSSGPRIGDLAPDFVLPALDGRVHKLSNHRGNPVLVNLWATWCPPCIAEMPLLDAIVRDYGPRGLVVLGVAGDDDDARVRGFVAEKRPAFQVLLDPGGTVGTQYGITGYPETFLVDRDGKLVATYIGPLPSNGESLAPSIRAVIESALSESG